MPLSPIDTNTVETLRALGLGALVAWFMSILKEIVRPTKKRIIEKLAAASINAVITASFFVLAMRFVPLNAVEIVAGCTFLGYLGSEVVIAAAAKIFKAKTGIEIPQETPPSA